MPVAGRKYVMGVDTAHGIKKGDYAAMAVIEAETCTLVATWRERCDPHIWGQKAALLGWLFNEALMAVETFPSAHGVTAVNEAMRLGYKAIYLRKTTGSVVRETTKMLGFHTSVRTKPMIIDRIKKGLEDQSSYIFDEGLLQELRTRSENAKGEMDGPGHDDMIVAYGISLLVRDESWVAGKLRPVAAEPHTYHDRYWEAWKKRVAKPAQRKPPPWGLNPPWRKPTGTG